MPSIQPDNVSLCFHNAHRMNIIKAEELDQWIQSGKDFVLVDVREDWERAAFHIGGVHIPLSELLQRKEEIPADKPVVVYCEKGIRSHIVIQRLQEQGYDNLYNLIGGMKAWPFRKDNQ